MSLPNALTVLRMVLTAFLYIPALTGHRAVLLWGFVAAFATDVLDGYLARKLGQTSYIGMRLDSWADYFLIASAVVWSLVLAPDLFRMHPVWWAAIVTAIAVPQAISLFRFGINSGFHLYTSRAAGCAAAILFVHAMVTGKHSFFLLYAFGILAIAKSIEETLICLIVKNPFEDLRPSALLYLMCRPR